MMRPALGVGASLNFIYSRELAAEVERLGNHETTSVARSAGSSIPLRLIPGLTPRAYALARSFRFLS